ncbi:hypothetical protein FB567DRAFT_548144 [Paraphoma chrysanthemicola]|uniref:Uncharacterized protein n=1 Tax=Paraphoma chrysanthemicola TaxID=798071 RepID=A0A8K0R7R7_9PLEO|nr:hypothetical protein FB567DRAFT_548144 [Paraphoma chrysanthemicola]
MKLLLKFLVLMGMLLLTTAKKGYEYRGFRRDITDSLDRRQDAATLDPDIMALGAAPFDVVTTNPKDSSTNITVTIRAGEPDPTPLCTAYHDAGELVCFYAPSIKRYTVQLCYNYPPSWRTWEWCKKGHGCQTDDKARARCL